MWVTFAMNRSQYTMNLNKQLTHHYRSAHTNQSWASDSRLLFKDPTNASSPQSPRFDCTAYLAYLSEESTADEVYIIGRCLVWRQPELEHHRSASCSCRIRPPGSSMVTFCFLCCLLALINSRTKPPLTQRGRPAMQEYVVYDLSLQYVENV